MNKPITWEPSSSTRPQNVVPFPNLETDAASGTGGQIWEEIRQELEHDLSLKKAIEGAVMSVWYQATQRLPDMSDDPFDPIFIARLRADKILPTDIDLVRKYSTIKDLSPEIHFADGWDD